MTNTTLHFDGENGGRQQLCTHTQPDSFFRVAVRLLSIPNRWATDFPTSLAFRVGLSSAAATECELSL